MMTKVEIALQRNLYENTLKMIAERSCEDLNTECAKTGLPAEAWCCPCTAKVTLQSQKDSKVKRV